MRLDSLPVLEIPCPLRQLCPEVDKVAREQKAVSRGDGKGIAHERCRVEGQSCSHSTGYSSKLRMGLVVGL